MPSRRSFIRSTLYSIAALSANAVLPRTGNSKPKETSPVKLGLPGPLQAADVNGVMLPAGFSSRVVARSGVTPHAGSDYIWHDAPDGGATFATKDGGWIYVSNSEVDEQFGGVGALQFDALGNIIHAHAILENTSRNCAGGATSWGSWISCEETNDGLAWECDPYGQQPALPLPAMGRFQHEAVAQDLRSNNFYLTEDKIDGCLYRFVPASVSETGVADLSHGSLEVAVVDAASSRVDWLAVPDASASSKPLRYQVKTATPFKGGEGIVYHDGVIYFATKGDNRIWSYHTTTQQLTIYYDAMNHTHPILTGVDNIALSQDGALLVAEDGGDLQIVVVTRDNLLAPLIQLVGHDASEITGPAFSPDGTRLYFSSQRGTTGNSDGGITFEITGPFHKALV